MHPGNDTCAILIRICFVKVLRITSFVIMVGFQMTSYGRLPDLFKASTMIFECSATCARHSSPYRSCDPVQNQN